MTSKSNYIQGFYSEIGPSRSRGGCVEADFITINDITLNNVLMDKEAFDLLELGEDIEITFIVHRGITYITYVRFGHEKVSSTPSFAYREAIKLGFQSFGLVLIATAIVSILYPDFLMVASSGSFPLIPVGFLASFVFIVIKYATIQTMVVRSKKWLPIID